MLIGNTCALRVTAPEPDAARVLVRQRQFLVGRPIEFDTASPRIAALEYAVGAIGAEVVGGLREFASRRRIEVDHVEAVVTATLEHELVYLEVVGEEGRPRITRVHLKVFVAAPDDGAVRRLWDDLPDHLPLLSTWRSAVHVDLELAITQ
jgi:hypothetical protein